MAKEYAYQCVQCTTDTGETGDFLVATTEKTDRKPISPVFPSLVEFYAWAKIEGWDGDSTLKEPFRMSREVKSA